MTGIVLAQLSDIHFNKVVHDGVYDLDRDLRNELETDLVGLCKEVGWPDGIVVSGDIAFGGTANEYEIATDWLAQLCHLVHCEDYQVWVVPGNHDVDRNAVADSEILKTLHDEVRRATDADREALVTGYFRDANGGILFEPLRAYNRFASKYECAIDAKTPHWETTLYLNDGSELRLRGANSALVSDKNDDNGANKLFVPQVTAQMERRAGVEYVFICHHPPDWLLGADTIDGFVRTRCKVQLYGHKHSQHLAQHDQSVRIVAGAVHPSRKEDNWLPRYNVLSLEVRCVGTSRRLVLDVHPRVWNPEQLKFVPEYYEGRPLRNFELELEPWSPPPGTHGARPKVEQTVTSEQPTRASVIPEEWRRRLVYRFLGLPFYSRLRLASSLDLLQVDDEGVPEAELLTRILSRAVTSNKIEALSKAVEEEYQK